MPATSTLSRNDRLIGGVVYRTCTSVHHTEGDRELPRTNELFYHRPNGNIDVWCRECVRTYNREQRRKRAAGRVTRRSVTARKFGVEMEFYGDRDLLIREMRNRGVTCNAEGYNHQVRSAWKVVTDGSVYGGWELVSPPLAGVNGMDQLRKACEALAAANCTVQRSCGLHVHHDCSDLDARALGRLFRSWHRAQAAIDQLVAPSRRRSQWARPLSDAEVANVEALPNTRPETVRSQFRFVDRYRALNVACYPRQGTIEVRQHQGALNFAKISAWVEFGQALITKATGDADLADFTTAETLIDDLAGHGLAAEQVTYLKGRASYFASRVAA